jgi:RHS repeat-associated protein
MVANNGWRRWLNQMKVARWAASKRKRIHPRRLAVLPQAEILEERILLTTATMLAIGVGPPTTGTAGKALTPVLTVDVEDSAGHIVTTNSSKVTLTVGSGPGRFASGATTSVAAIHGVATFTNLIFDTAGSYKLSASDGSLTKATSTTLIIDAAAATKLGFQQVPAMTTAGKALNPAVTVAVEDQYGNVLPGNTSTVTLSVASGPGVFATGSTTNGAAVNGVAAFSDLIFDTPGTYTLGASDGSLTKASSAKLTISAAPPARMVFQQVASSGTAGKTLSPSYRVAVEDQFGNVVTGNTSTVTLEVASGPGGFASGSTTSVAAVKGIATFTNLVLDASGTYTLGASDGSLTKATFAALTIKAAAAAKLAFQQVPASGTAENSLSPAVIVDVEDQFSNVVTGNSSMITLAVASGPGVFASGSTTKVAAVQGVATFSKLVVTSAGTYTLGASDGSLTKTTSGNIVVSSAGAPAKVVLQTVPGSGTAGSALSPAVTVEVEDQFGNVLTGNTSTVTLAVGTGPGGFASGSTTSVATVNGVATFTNLLLDTEGTYTLSASDGALAGATSGSIVVSPANAAKVVLQTVPGSGTAGSALSPVVTVGDISTVTLTVASGPGGFDSSSTTIAAAVNGLASFTNLTLDTAGTYTLGASDGSLADATSGSIVISPTSAVNVVFKTVPSSGTTGQALSPSLTVAVEDGSGNVVADDDSTVTLTVATGPGKFASTSTVSVAAVNGIATFANVLLDIAGPYSFSANDGSLASATSGTFAVNSASAGRVVFWRVPPSGLAGQALSPTLTVAVEDNFGNIITGDSSTVTLSVADGPGDFDSESTTNAVAVNGIATFSNLILDTAGAYSFSAGDGSLGGATSTGILINPVPSSSGTQLAFERVPASGTAGQPLSPAIVVAVEDQYGNVVTSDDSTVTLAPKAGPGIFTNGGTVNVEAINGIATFTNLVLDTAGTYVFVPSDGTLMAGPTQIVTVIPAQASQLFFEQLPTTGIAGQTLNPSVIVAVEDQFGNIVTSDDSTVTLTVNSGPGSFTGGNTLSASVVNGIATFSNLVLDTAGNYLLSASDGPLSSATSSLLTVTAAPATHLLFTQVPTTAIAGQSLEPAVTVAVEDQFGNVFPLTPSVVSLAIASGPDNFDSNSVTSVFDGGNGMATFPSLIFDMAGTYTLSASDGSLTGALSADIAVKSLWSSPSQPFLESNLSFSNPIGPASASTISVEYTNVGDVAMTAPLLTLTATQNGQSGALLTLDPSGANPTQSVQLPTSGSTSGLLQPGESVTVPVYYTGWLAGQWNASDPTTFTLAAQTASTPISTDVATNDGNSTSLSTNEINYSPSGTLLSTTQQQINDNADGTPFEYGQTETTYNPDGSVAITASTNNLYYPDGSLQSTDHTVTNPDNSGSNTYFSYYDGSDLGPESTQSTEEYIPGGTVEVTVTAHLAEDGSGSLGINNYIGAGTSGQTTAANGEATSLTTQLGTGGIIISSVWNDEVILATNGAVEEPEYVATAADGTVSYVSGTSYSTAGSPLDSTNTSFFSTGGVSGTNTTVVHTDGSTENQSTSYYLNGALDTQSDELMPAIPNNTFLSDRNVAFNADGSGSVSLQTNNPNGSIGTSIATTYSTGGVLATRLIEFTSYYPGTITRASLDIIDQSYIDNGTQLSHDTYAVDGTTQSDCEDEYYQSGMLHYSQYDANYSPVYGFLSVNSASYADNYTVDANQSYFQTTFNVANSLGPSGPSILYVEYTNTGSRAMQGPTLTLTATQNGQTGALLALSPIGSSPPQYEPSVTFSAISNSLTNELEPGATEVVPIYYGGWLPGQWQTGVPVTLSLQVSGASNPLLGNEALLGNFLATVTDPNTFGPVGPATVYVQYRNTENVAVAAPLLMVTANQNGQAGALLSLDPSATTFSQSIEFLASGSTPGMLQPGETVTVPVYYEGWLPGQWQANVVVEFLVQPIETSNTSTINWSTIEGAAKPPTISSTAWVPIFKNLESSIGPSWGDYVSMLDANAQYLGTLGENIADPATPWSFELQQAIGLGPIQDIGTTVDDQVAVPGLPLEFSRTFSSSIVGRSQTGPLGLGWSDNWDISLAVQADGTVVVSEPGDTQVSFTPNGSGGYTDQPGDHETLTSLGGGAFSLEETNGTLTVFNPNGTLDYVQDTNGNRITSGYTDGLLTSLTDSSGQSLSIGYNSEGLISTVTDSFGRTTTYTYDPTDQYLMAVTGFNGQTTSYTYDTSSEAGQNALTSIAFPGGTHQYFTYDNGARLTSTYSDGGIQPQFFGYSFGEVSQTDGAGDTTSLYYNDQGLLVKTVDPLGNATLDSYDSNFNLTAVTNAEDQSETYAYNAAGAITSSTDFLGNTTTFSYSGPFNKLSSMTDANGNTTGYSYDSAGNLLTTTYANGDAETFTYNPEGEATSFVNANGQPISYGYNAAGQLANETFSGGSEYTYTYNGLGNLVTATDATGTTTFTYAPVSDLLTGVSYPNGTSLTFRYNAAGQRTQLVDQTGFTVNYVYDTAGRLNGLTDANGNPIVTYTYDAAGRLAQKINGNGTYTTYTYYADGNILDLVNYAPGGTVNSQFAYTYNGLGLETSEATLDGTWSYTYNVEGELSQAIFASTTPSIPNQDLVYNYDAVGNRTSTVVNGVTTVYTPNNVTEYTSVGGTPYVYDADGNLLSDGTNTYTYNALSELTSVSGPSGTTTYTYNALGQRVASTSNGQTTHYLIDPASGSNVIGTYSGTGTLIANYAYGLGLTSQDTASGSAYYDFDGIGSTVGLSNAAGSYVNSYSYLPFGESLMSSQTVPNPFQFVGQLGVMTEAAGTDLMQARYFDSLTGRFLSADPLGLAGGQTNLFTYVMNSPTNYTDASGTKIDASFVSSNNISTLLIGGVVLAALAPAAGPELLVAIGIGIAFDLFPNPSDSYLSWLLDDFHNQPNTPTASPGDQSADSDNLDEQIDPNWGLVVESSADQMQQSADNPGIPLSLGGEDIPFSVLSEDFNDKDPDGAQLPIDTYQGAGDGSGSQTTVTDDASGAVVSSATYYFGPGGAFDASTTIIDTYAGESLVNTTTIMSYADGSSDVYETNYAADGSTEQWSTSYNADGTPSESSFTDSDGNTTSWMYDPDGTVNQTTGTDANGSDGGSDGGNGSDSGGNDGASNDPNWMVGPVGVGAQNFVSANAILPYRIDFENAPTATAAAKTVTITDQLSSNLDASTFELTGIGWRNTVLAVPSGSQRFETTVSMTENGQTFDVRVDAGINSQTGLISATFQSIDPSTGLPPSGLIGFLPPDNASGEGAGYLSFVVQPKMGLPTGTQIRNVALVTFDQNQPVATDQLNDENPALGIDPSKQALVTIDSEAAPASAQGTTAVSRTTTATVADVAVIDHGGLVAVSPTVTIRTPLAVPAPSEPVPLVVVVSDANAAARDAPFNFKISFGDETSLSVSSKGPLLVNHVYSQTGTFTIQVTATDEFGYTSAVATETIKVVPVAVETDPFNSKLSALFVGGTSGNDTIKFAASGNSGIVVTLNGVSEGTYSTSGPLIVFGQGGTDNVESDLDDQALQWAGLTAAVEILNA